MRLKAGFSVIEAMVAGAIVVVIGAGAIEALKYFQQEIAQNSSKTRYSKLEQSALADAYPTFLEQDGTVEVTGIYESETSVGSGSVLTLPLFGVGGRVNDSGSTCVGTLNSAQNYIQLSQSGCSQVAGSTKQVLSGLESLDLVSNPLPVYVDGADSICSVKEVDAGNRRLHLCANGECSGATTSCLPSTTGSVDILLPRYINVPVLKCSGIFSGNEFQLADCPQRYLSALDAGDAVFIRESSATTLEVSSDGRISERCQLTSVDQMTGVLTIDTSACDPLSESLTDPVAYILGSEDLTSEMPVAYFVEPLGAEGPAGLRLVMNDQYYETFENSVFAQPSSPVVPVQQADNETLSSATNSRLINPDGHIRVSIADEGTFTGDITLTLTVIDKDSEDLGSGRISLASGAPLSDAEDTDSDQALVLRGSVDDVNDSLEKLQYVADAGILDDQRLKVVLDSPFGVIESGSSADNPFDHISLNVNPFCGCEAGIDSDNPRTAVQLTLGRLEVPDDPDVMPALAFQSSPAPKIITTVALQGTESGAEFYGDVPANVDCIAPANHDNTPAVNCGSATKQQNIADSDAVAVMLYEDTDVGESSETLGRYTFVSFFDSHYERDYDLATLNNIIEIDGGFNNNCDGSASGSRYDAILAGRGLQEQLNSNYPNALQDKYGLINNDSDNMGNYATSDHVCRLWYQLFRVRNVNDTGETIDGTTHANYPMYVLDDAGEYEADPLISGNTLDVFLNWNRAHDGLAMALPTTSAGDLTTYNNGSSSANNNPILFLRYFNSLRSWKIRKIRTGEGNCSANEVSDGDAWARLGIIPGLGDGEGSPPASLTISEIDEQSYNALEVKVKTAKICPNPALFD